MNRQTDPILERLRDGDPLRDENMTSDEVETDLALHAMLTRISAEPPRQRARAQRGTGHLRPVRIGAVAAATGVAALVVVNVVSSGHGGIARTLGASGLGVAPAQADTLAAQVRHALTGPAGSILEVENVVSGRKSADDPLSTETIHYWERSDTPEDNVIQTTSDGQISTTGEQNGQLQYYDPRTNTIGVMTPTPAVEAGPGTTPRDQALTMLHAPGTTVDQSAEFDGQPAIELTSTSDGFVTTMFLARGSYTPLEYQTAASPSAPASEQGASLVMRYEIYRTEPDTGANSSLTSLTAQHPSASVVQQDSAAWNATESGLS